MSTLSKKLPGPLREHDLLLAVPDSHWPEIASARIDTASAVFEMKMSPELCWFDGHFPSQPVLPGVAQTHWACLLASVIFHQPGEFSALRRLKYKTPILPAQSVYLSLTHIVSRDQVSYKYHKDEVEFSTGVMVFGNNAV